MKKISSILFFVSMIFCGSVFADEVCKESAATLYCRQGSVDSIYFKGGVNLDQTKVLNGADISGGLTASGADFDTLTMRGSTVLTSSKVNRSLNARGQFNAKQVTLLGDSVISGNFVAMDLAAKSSIVISGSTYCQDCQFDSKATFSGAVRLINSKFNSNLEIFARDASFTDSTLQDIVIKIKTEDKPQVLILDGATTVNNITFVNQKGTVFVSKESKILGTVIGAEVHHE
jgi:hypothetical protein